MKCQDAQLLIGLPDDDPRAEEMRVHLLACARCRAVVDHQNNVRALLALKRYEQPPAGFSDRCAATIQRLLEQQPTTQTTWWHAWHEHFVMALQPFRLAAAAVLVLGLGFYFLRPATEVSAPLTAPVSWVQIRAEPPAASAPLAVVQNEVPMLQSASNSGSFRMEYGPGTAVPVKFDY